MLARFLIALTLFQVIKATFTDKEELIAFIKSLNDDENDQSESNDFNVDSEKRENLDDTAKEQKLREILWLLKKNYDVKKQNKKLLETQNTPRLVIISNPEVLDDYKKFLNKDVFNYKALNKIRRNSLWDQDNSNRVGAGGASHLERPSKPKQKKPTYSNEQDADLGENKEDRLSQIRKLKKTFKDYSIEHKETPKKYDFDQELNKNDNFKEYSLGHRDPPKRPQKQMLIKQKVFGKGPEYSSEQRVPLSFANRPNKKRINKMIRKQDFDPPRNRYDDHRPRPKLSKSRLSQGRTSIPFMGAKHVYEE